MRHVLYYILQLFHNSSPTWHCFPKTKREINERGQLGSDKNSFQVADNNKINLGVHLKEDSEQTGFRERKKNLLFALMTKKNTPATNGHA